MIMSSGVGSAEYFWLNASLLADNSAKGLNPSMFWEHAADLLASDPGSINGLVQSLIQQAVLDGDIPKSPISLSAIVAVKSQLYIGQHQGGLAPSLPSLCNSMIYIDTTPGLNNPSNPDLESAVTRPVLHLNLPSGKRSQTTFLVDILPLSVAFAQHHLLSSGDPSK